MKVRMPPLPRLPADDLPTPEVGSWAESKYDLIRYFSTLFTSSMKGKWGSLPYLDLFSGSGRARIRGTMSILPSSASIALGLPQPFDRYVFCESEPDLMGALQTRATRDFPSADCRFVPGDVNGAVDSILEKLPAPKPDFKVLTFCLADPCKLRDLHFDTIRRLSVRFMDFMVLIPSEMDANRNIGVYLNPENSIMSTFLGNAAWRDEWARYADQDNAGAFVADQFGKQMAALGYLYEGLESAWLNRSTGKNLPLYHLMLFSRHPLGSKFWKEALEYTDPQMDLGL